MKAADDKTPPDAADAILTALWAQVLADFDDDERHNKVLEHARSTGGLSALAARYQRHRASLGDEIADAIEEKIQKRLAAIALVAVAELEATRGTPQDITRAHTLLKVAVFVLFMGAMLGLLKALLI